MPAETPDREPTDSEQIFLLAMAAGCEIESRYDHKRGKLVLTTKNPVAFRNGVIYEKAQPGR